MVERTHEFPGWVTNYRPDGATPIPWEDVLRAQGEECLIPDIENDLVAKRAFDALFGG